MTHNPPETLADPEGISGHGSYLSSFAIDFGSPQQKINTRYWET